MNEFTSRRVNSTVGRRFVSEPGAIADGSWTQLALKPFNRLFSPAKAGAEFRGNVIPGLRSSRHVGTRSPGATIFRRFATR
jgi:hypothetical protein